MKKLISTVLACVLMLALTVTAFADDTKYSYGHFYYRDHDGYVSIAGYLGSETEITVPSSIAGKPVSEIESGAFDGADSIQTITLPDTVVMVYDDSFTGAGALNRIVCKSAIDGISAPDGVELIQPEAGSQPIPSVPEPSYTTSSYRAPVQYPDPVQTYRDDIPVITSPAETADTTQQPAEIQDEDIGDYAYEEDSLFNEPAGEESDNIAVKNENAGRTDNEAVSDKSTETPVSSDSAANEVRPVTSSSAAVIAVTDSVSDISVNDEGQLVGIDESGNTTVIDDSRTYTTEEEPDGRVKIVDGNGSEVELSDDGDEIIISAVEETSRAETTSESGNDIPAPIPESDSANIVPIIIIAVAVLAVTAAVIAVSVLVRKK